MVHVRLGGRGKPGGGVRGPPHAQVAGLFRGARVRFCERGSDRLTARVLDGHFRGSRPVFPLLRSVCDSLGTFLPTCGGCFHKIRSPPQPCADRSWRRRPGKSEHRNLRRRDAAEMRLHRFCRGRFAVRRSRDAAIQEMAAASPNSDVSVRVSFHNLILLAGFLVPPFHRCRWPGRVLVPHQARRTARGLSP